MVLGHIGQLYSVPCLVPLTNNLDVVASTYPGACCRQSAMALVPGEAIAASSTIRGRSREGRERREREAERSERVGKRWRWAKKQRIRKKQAGRSDQSIKTV